MVLLENKTKTKLIFVLFLEGLQLKAVYLCMSCIASTPPLLYCGYPTMTKPRSAMAQCQGKLGLSHPTISITVVMKCTIDF